MENINQNEIEGNVIKSASKAVSKKFTNIVWKTIENNLEGNDLLVLKSLIAYSDSLIRSKEDTASIDTEVLRVVSDQNYPMIRKVFADAELVISSHDKKGKPNEDFVKRGCNPDDYNDPFEDGIFNKSKGKKSKGKSSKGPKLSGADMIRLSNTVSKLKKMSEELVKTFNLNSKNPQPQVGFRSEYIELIGMSFIYLMRHCIKHKERFSKKKYKLQVVSLMVSVQRFLTKCRNYIGLDPIKPGKHTKISQLFIKDLEITYEDINKVYPFDGLDVCENMPELLVYSSFDKYIPQLSISPREHQKKITSFFHKNYNNGFFAIYNAMIGSGKTTSIVSLAKIAEYYGVILLCVCNLDTVRTQMANICYNSEIKFAIGSLHDNNTIKLTNHFSCKKDSDRRVIICGPDVGYAILNEKSNTDKPTSEKYLLFHDEPNCGADIKNSDTLRSNVKIIRVMPKWTIYSSATAPTLQDLTPVISGLKKKYPDMVVDKIYSPTVYIGCDVRTLGGELVVPYIGCTEKKDLLNVIQKCEDVPFLGRMLTTKVAMHLWHQMKQEKIKDIPDIPVMFCNINNMKADKIRQIVLKMLELLSEQSSDVIKKICRSELIDNDANVVSKPKKETNDDDDGFDWASESDEETTEKDKDDAKHPLELNIKNLSIGGVWKNASLIASNEPCKDAIVIFKPLLDILYENGFKSATRIYSDYGSNIRDFELKKQKALKNIEKSEVDKLRIENEMDESRPTFNFPEWAHIGTKEYNVTFVPKHKRTQINDIRYPLNLETLDIESMNVPDEFIMLLYCGVGIYSPDNIILDDKYTSTVMNLASIGKLAYVIADNSISFGTNYPFARVIILEPFSKKHSMYTQFQLMGRAGRVGKSAKAEARISDSMGRSIVDFVIHPDKYNIEIENIIDMLNILEEEDNKQIQDELTKLEEEILAVSDISEKKEFKFEVIDYRKKDDDIIQIEKEVNNVNEKQKLNTKEIDLNDTQSQDSNSDSKNKKTFIKRGSNHYKDTNKNTETDIGSWRRKNTNIDNNKDTIRNTYTNNSKPKSSSGKYVPPNMRRSNKNEFNEDNDTDNQYHSSRGRRNYNYNRQYDDNGIQRNWRRGNRTNHTQSYKEQNDDNN